MEHPTLSPSIKAQVEHRGSLHTHTQWIAHCHTALLCESACSNQEWPLLSPEGAPHPLKQGEGDPLLISDPSWLEKQFNGCIRRMNDCVTELEGLNDYATYTEQRLKWYEPVFANLEEV